MKVSIKTIIKKIKELFKITNSKKIDKKSKIKFREYLIKENLNRFLLFLGLVIVAQIVYIIFELSKNISEMLILRFSVIIIATMLIFIFYFQSKKNIDKYSPYYSKLLLIAVQCTAYIMAFYFVSHMFSIGIYSFTAYLIVAYVISLTYAHSPHYTGICKLLFFIGLTFHINFFIVSISLWYEEFIVSLIFLVLLYIGSIFNYKKQFKLYCQEKEIISQNEKLKTLLQFDELTGIYNRKEIFKRLEEKISMTQRYNTPFCITIIDIDHFKNVNDTFGHNVGDEVLKAFTSKIKSMLRNTDIFGRWGGEEFVIILPNSNAEDAFSFIERIRKSIEESNFPTVGHVTFSAGISMYSDEKDASELAGKADFAMYLAKDSGRNRTQVFKKTV